MKKYLAAIMACVLSTTLVLSGCGKSTNKSEESENTNKDGKNVTVRYLAPANDVQRKIFDGLFANVKEKMNITVDPEYVANWDDFNQKFMTQLSAKNAPDVVDVSVTYKDQFINSGYLYDIAPLAKENKFDFSKYYDAHFEGFRRGEALYGMPNGTTLMAIYYNKNIFEEAGLPLPSEKWEEAPTWDEFYETVASLSKGEGANRQYGFTTSFDICWMFPLFWQNGADFVKPDASASAMNTPEAIETLEYINKLMFEKEYSPTLSTLKTLPPNELFKSGRVAMYMDGNWYMDAMAEIDAFEWGVCPLPRNDETVTGMYIDSWSVTADTKHPKEAYQVVEYLISEEALQSKSAKGIPSMISIAEEEIDNIYSFVDEASRATWSSALAVGKTPTYTKNWAQVIAEANKGLEKLALGELTPAQTAAEIEKSTNALIK